MGVVVFREITDLPDDVFGIEIHGKITHDDYVNHIIPIMDKKLEIYKRIKVLYVIGHDFQGAELAAMWDDVTYGTKHWRDISHIAVACDLGWVRSMMAAFSPLFPGMVQSFPLSDYEYAHEWVSDLPKNRAA